MTLSVPPTAKPAVPPSEGTPPDGMSLSVPPVTTPVSDINTTDINTNININTNADAITGGLIPGVVHTVESPEQFDALLTAAASTGGLLVADFMAKWCRKCVYLKARLPKLALDNPAVYFCIIDVNSVARLPREYSIAKMPTFVFIRDKAVLESYVGADEAPQVKRLLRERIEKYTGAAAVEGENE